jgi:hypothetical protein
MLVLLCKDFFLCLFLCFLFCFFFIDQFFCCFFLHFVTKHAAKIMDKNLHVIFFFLIIFCYCVFVFAWVLSHHVKCLALVGLQYSLWWWCLGLGQSDIFVIVASTCSFQFMIVLCLVYHCFSLFMFALNKCLAVCLLFVFYLSLCAFLFFCDWKCMNAIVNG